MPTVRFTAHLRHFAPAPVAVAGETVRQALDVIFADTPLLAGYVLDDQHRLRRHVALFVNGQRAALDDRIDDGADIAVLQALSGG